MYRRILSALMACLMLCLSAQVARAERYMMLEGALRLSQGGAIIHGAGQDEDGTRAWCAKISDEGEILYQAQGEKNTRFVQAMPWGKGVALIAFGGENAECKMVCLDEKGKTVKAPEMPEGTAYLRLALKSVLAYGAYQGKDGGYVLRLTRLGEDGKKLWQQDYSAHAQGWNLPLAADDGKMIYFVGAWNQEGGTVYSALGMDENGQILWNTALEADAVTSIRAGKNCALVLGSDNGGDFAVRLDAQGRQQWKIDLQEKLLDGAVQGENTCLLTQNEGMLCVLQISPSGEILSQRIIEYLDGALDAGEDGNVFLYGMDGEDIHVSSIEAYRPQEQTAMALSMEWIGLEEKKDYVVSDQRPQNAIRNFLQEGKAIQERPHVGGMGARRFDILMDEATLHLYWNALEEVSYLQAGDIWYEMDAGCGEYLLNMCREMEDENLSWQVEEGHAQYLRSFGWEIAWKSGEEKQTLPETLNWTAADENALYWAYHAQLVEMGGGNVQEALGEEVRVVIYAVHPQKWDGAKHKMLYAVLLEKEGSILGGFVSLGSGAETVWSLQGENRIENINRFLLERQGDERTQVKLLDEKALAENFLMAWQRGRAEEMLLAIAPRKALDEMIRAGAGKRLYVSLKDRMQSGEGWPGKIEGAGEVQTGENAVYVSCLREGQWQNIRFEMRKKRDGLLGDYRDSRSAMVRMTR